MGTGIYNCIKFKKNQKEQVLSKKRIEIFQEEAKKIIGKDDVSLSDEDVVFMVNLNPLEYYNYYIAFKDHSFLRESYVGNDLLECTYYSDGDKMVQEIDGVDLSGALLKAYDKKIK